MSEQGLPIEAAELLKLLPHRHPMLLVDRVVELEAGSRVVAMRHVTLDDPFFAGHFPGNPVMPGVLIVEALAQAATVLGFVTRPELRGNGGVLLMGIDGARFRKQVLPGDTLDLEVSVKRRRGTVWTLDGKARVGGSLVAEAQLMATFYEGEIRG